MKWFVLILLILLFLAGGYYLFYAQKNPTADSVNLKNESKSSTQTVYITDTKVDPETANIKVGETLTFTNADDTDHSIIGNGGIDSGELGPEENYRQKFDTAGTYLYHCQDKPELSGKVVVK